MHSGYRVRIKSAPDRIGVLVGEPQVNGERKRWTVQFPDKRQSFPENNLELVEDSEKIEDLIESGNYGGAKNLRGAIIHARLTGRLADVVYSMESTNTDYYAYQFKPVLNFLRSPSNGILIADEVGLGKTIEAGLIWTELRARHDSRRLLVICPAHLCDKWVKELSLRFGIRAERQDAGQLLSSLKQSLGSRESFVAVASLQSLRPPKDWENSEVDKKSALLARYIDDNTELESLFDCVIIDEAHYMRNPASQTHALGRSMRSAAKYIVLLSATPIQLKSDDLFHLLNIIDRENFEFKGAFDNVLEANKPIMALTDILRRPTCTVAALGQYVEQCLSHRLLKSNRQLVDILANLPSQTQLDNVNFRAKLANRMERINLLGSVLNRTLKRDVKEQKVLRKPIALQIEMTKIERTFYENVTDSVRSYCHSYGLFEGFILTIPQRQMCSSMPAALRSWERAEVNFDEEDMSVSELEGGSKDVDKSKLTRKSGPLINELAQIGNQLGSYDELRKNDSKYGALIANLQKYWAQYPNNKIIVFSFYRETLKYLNERLTEDGIRSVLIMGGMGNKKQKLVQDFKESNDVNILLASEVLSEGVDLQFSSTLINYDLPWNPMKIEQRIGRIDRIGQKEDSILIWNLFYSDTLDDRIYHRLFDRLGIFEQAFGVYEAILGDKLKNLQTHLLTHPLSPSEEQEQIDQTCMALATEKQNQDELESNAAGLMAHGDYVLNEVAAAKQMGRFIDGDSLWIYVRDFIKRNYPGTVLVQTNHDPVTIDIELDTNLKVELMAYIDKTKVSHGTKLSAATFGKPISCIFKNNVTSSGNSSEIINHQHPLVRYISSNTQISDFHQTVAISINKRDCCEVSAGIYMIVAKHWSTSGAKTTEQIVYRGIDFETKLPIEDIASEAIVMSALSFGEDWLGSRAHINACDAAKLYSILEDSLDDSFEEYCSQMSLENADNIELLITTSNSHFDHQIANKKNSIGTLRQKNNHNMVPLFDAQIRKLEEKKQMKKIGYEKKLNIKSEPKDLFCGIYIIL